MNLVIQSDSQGAINTVNPMLDTYYKRQRVCAHSDVSSHIEGNLPRTKQVKLTWVKAHQDESPGGEKLPIAAKMNIEADALAGEYLKQNSGIPLRNTLHFDSIGVNALSSGVRVTAKHKASIRAHVSGREMRRYLQEKHNWDEEMWECIDWEALEQSMRSTKDELKTGITKFLHWWWNVVERKRLEEPNAPADYFACPRCGKANDATTCSLLSSPKS